MALFGWFWWYLWPTMAYWVSQEFPTVYLDITATFIIFVSLRVRILLSDIWSRSRSSFWVTVHASWVLMSAKQPPVYRLNQSHLCCKWWHYWPDMTLFERFWRCLWHRKLSLSQFCRFCVYSHRMAHVGWFFWYLWPKMASKCPRNFRPPPWILLCIN